MSKRTLKYIVIGWCVLTLIEYYIFSYFIVAILWIVLSFIFFAMALIQVINVIMEWKSLNRFRVVKTAVFLLLFYLTFNRLLVSGLIEKVDWTLLYSKRSEIVEQVKRKKLNPNVSGSDVECALPFSFPVVSSAGNEIMINRNETGDTATVTFWVFRNFFEAPSTAIIYTNDNDAISRYEKEILLHPANNWKLKDNWYRIKE